MTSKGTDRRTIRVDESLWTAFGDAAASAGEDRAGVLRDFMCWYVRRPDAALPERPGAPAVEETSGGTP